MQLFCPLWPPCAVARLAASRACPRLEFCPVCCQHPRLRGAHAHCCVSQSTCSGLHSGPTAPPTSSSCSPCLVAPGPCPPHRHVTSLPALPTFHPAPAARGQNRFSRRLVSFREDQSLCEPSHLQYNGAFFLTRRYCLSINNNVTPSRSCVRVALWSSPRLLRPSGALAPDPVCLEDLAGSSRESRGGRHREPLGRVFQLRVGLAGFARSSLSPVSGLFLYSCFLQSAVDRVRLCEQLKPFSP